MPLWPTALFSSCFRDVTHIFEISRGVSEGFSTCLSLVSFDEQEKWDNVTTQVVPTSHCVQPGLKFFHYAVIKHHIRNLWWTIKRTGTCRIEVVPCHAALDHFSCEITNQANPFWSLSRFPGSIASTLLTYQSRCARPVTNCTKRTIFHRSITVIKTKLQHAIAREASRNGVSCPPDKGGISREWKAFHRCIFIQRVE